MNRTLHREPDWVFPHIAYTPEKMGEKMPLVLQLHGSGERGNGKEELERVEKWGFPEMAKAGEYPCIFAFPQCPDDTFWVARVESILRFLDQLIDRYPVDTDRIYLTGLSMGGYGTWYTAMAAPKRFAAIAPVCGGGMPWNAEVLKMPVWAFHGVIDTSVSVRESDEMVAELIKCGADVRYSRVENVGHRVWLNAYNEELLSWLLEQKRG